MSWLPKKSVVVPVDFSEQSLAAVETARTMVDAANQLHVIHALPDLSPVDPALMWDATGDERRVAHAKKELEGKFSDPKYAGLDIHVVLGDPGQAIVDYAQTVLADLIVMPSHGRTGLSRLLIGSVAERVVRLAHCPVLVLRQ